MTGLVLSTKWHEGFGIDGDELDDDNLLNYMKKNGLYFIIMKKRLVMI